MRGYRYRCMVCTKDAPVPTVKRFATCTIYVYADDHNPPHFHLVNAESEALIRIEDLKVMRGAVDRSELSEAVSWAVTPDGRETLWSAWRKYNERE